MKKGLNRYKSHYSYLSDEYKGIYKDFVQTCRSNRNNYVTNDLMYEMVCDLLRIKSNCFLEENSVFNKKYRYTRETLTTKLGQKRLGDDNHPRLDM